jgi:pullulanase/glycogen debranching enzyme
MNNSSNSARRGMLRLACALLGATLVLGACGGGGDSGSSNSGSTGGGTPSTSTLKAGFLRVHLWRKDGIYTNWGVYSWSGPKVPSTGWPGNRFLFDQKDSYGGYTDIELDTSKTKMDFLVTVPTADGKDATKNCSSDQSAAFTSDVASKGQQIWLKESDCTVYSSQPAQTAANLSLAKAVWLSADTIVWPGATASGSYKLYYAANGGLTLGSSGITGADGSLDLTPGTLSDAQKAQYPQYASATAFKLPAGTDPKPLLTDEVAVVQIASGAVIDGSQLQLAPALDAVYASVARSQALGLSFANDVPTFSVWAPTAKSVSLNVYDSASATTPSSTVAMAFDAASGIWRYTAADSAWTNSRYYSYSVKVYSRAANNGVVTNTVADPYAISLNAFDASNPGNLHAMVLNLADAAAKPAGWDSHVSSGLPAMLDGVDSSIYELHVRDFSVGDGTVSTAQAGKFEAFNRGNIGATSGMKHLGDLAKAGLTHVHLLPAFEFASVDELHCANPSIPTSAGADLTAQTAAVAAQNSDCFNWGYDPLVYGVPEGSYSSNANDGSAWVKEFRDMVMGLHGAGLRVIMDVVYNHTPSSGQAGTSILDKIVPGYYYRQDGNGNVANQSGAGADIAAENAMAGKLVTDTLVRWADQYKVDGFRFDIMGLMPKQLMLDVQAALNNVALADGRRPNASAPGVYLYGEGWSEGGLAFTNAQQSNMAGTGIGTFNDRLRDAVRGGGPFDSGGSMVSHQGFINGLCYDNNDGSSCDTASSNVNWCDNKGMSQQACLFTLQSRISVGLAGNLAAFPLNSSHTGAQLSYFGGPTGYTGSPQENISYISVHDNETVFDVSQYKQPIGTSGADRARAQVVGMSIVALSQGVPFFHAGDDLLRSKSMDGNSYNSGDYFNRIDWTGSGNNWAVGAPPQNTGNNANNLSAMSPILNAASTAVSAADIAHTTLAFQDFLRIRQDSSMFRLKTAAAIQSCVSFPDQGAQKAGLIVMRISGAAGCGDSKYKSIVVLFNANKAAQSYSLASYAGHSVQLHPLQAGGSDSVVKAATFSGGSFSVPARSTAVFVEP